MIAAVLAVLAVLAWALAAIVLGSASLTLLSGSHSRHPTAVRDGVSPACLPTTLAHTAALAGTHLDVSPEPEAQDANPDTQISFLGAPAAQIRAVAVVGARSGAHPGHLRPYSQGDGASFVPDAPFEEGERVTVRAVIGAGSAARPLAFRFSVDTPYPTRTTPQFPNPQAAQSEYQSFATMPGVHPPILTVTVPDGDPGAGDVLTTNGPGPGQYGPLIYTPQGQLVWFYRLPAGETAEDLNEQSYEGRRALTWWRGRVLELGFGQGEDVVMDSSYRTVARIGGGNGLKADLHDFQIAPDAVAYITAYNPIRCDLSSLKGAPDGAIIDTAVQEIDMRTGLVRWEWHSLEHVGASESQTPAATDTTPWDWFHVNSIDPEPDGNLLISARNTWASYQLQAGTGRILWRLGGTTSSFRMGPGTEVAWQHDARMLPDGEVTLFDDGSNPPIHHQSRALRIALEPAQRRARLRLAYTHPSPAVLAPSQGNMQTLADGNTLVGYGGVPQVSEYSPRGALLLDAHLPYDMAFYRAFRFPWSARPSTPPAVLANLNNTGEETVVRTSWNGATGVAGWRVLAGEHRGSLAAGATIPSSGFESSTVLPRRYRWVAVQALDATGQVLDSSHAVAVISYAASLSGARSR